MGLINDGVQTMKYDLDDHDFVSEYETGKPFDQNLGEISTLKCELDHRLQFNKQIFHNSFPNQINSNTVNF